MKNRFYRLLPALMAGLLLMTGTAFAAGAPASSPAAQKIDLDQLLNEVRQSRGSERLINQEREQRFLRARNEQQALLREARTEEQQLEKRADELRAQFERNEARLAELEQDLATRSGELTDVFGIARQSALEAQASIKNTMLSVQFKDWPERLNEVSNRPHALTIEDLETLWLTILEATAQNGKVVRFQAPVITAQGEETEKTVTRVGVFNAVADGRFLRYLPETVKLVELSRQPPARFTSLVAQLEETREGYQVFPVDPSRGGILALIVHSPGLAEHIEAGGVIGYIIILIGVIAAGIVVYRVIALSRLRRQMAVQAESEEQRPDNPLGRLHIAAQQAAELSSKSLSARLHEKIGEEAALMHKGLRTLGIFAAVAPLLGLLGTVTGMIETFQSITLFGAGDPRIMSGGISEALVTTELGLIVAIPALLAHSFLTGRANRLVEVLEHHSTRLMAASGKEH
jgi:biopolymer transport protein ExbB